MNRRVRPRNEATAPAASAERRPAADRAPLADRLHAWRDQHVWSALSSLGRLWQRRVATLLTVAVLGIALALPLLLHLVVSNLAAVGGSVGDAREINAFLVAGTDADGARAARDRLAALPGVATVELRSPDDGLAELSKLDGFGEALALVGDNPLPWVAVVAPQGAVDLAALESLAGDLAADAAVDHIAYDFRWRERLGALLAVARRGLEVLAALLALAVLLVVGNTIRLDIAARADEIAVVQAIGGSDGFVRRPFLYAGCWYGLGAGIVALLAVLIVRAALAGPVAALAASYGVPLSVAGPGPAAAAATLGGGIVLGWLGARLAAGRELARRRPVGD